jgi:hypothetical protein
VSIPKEFNEKMLKVKKLIEPVAFKAIISGVKRRSLWKELYALPKKILLKVKQAIENHIQVEEASVLHHGPSSFSKKYLLKRFPKWDSSLRRENNPRKNHKRPVSEQITYPKIHITSLNATFI